MTQNIVIQAIKSLVIDIIGEILYFPLWWYGQGLKQTALYVFRSVKNSNRDLALGLMLKSLFKPMFGQYDRTGRLISFFMRFILTFSRLVIFLLITIFYIVVIIFWLLLPVVVAWGLYNNSSILWKR